MAQTDHQQNAPDYLPIPTGPNEPDTRSGLIAWFASNHVAANLLMLLIIFAGVTSIFTQLKTNMFPQVKPNQIAVTIIYPGANAEEVEEAIILRVEEALGDIKGVKNIESRASDSRANITIKVDRSYVLEEVMDDVKIQLDAINTFPLKAERPIISKVENEFALMAKQLQVYGDVDPYTLRTIVDEIETELLALPSIDTVEVYGNLPFEVSIEIPELTLRKYDLNLQQVANVIARSSFNLSGGTIRTEVGDIMIRASGQAYGQYDFENIVLITNPDGTRITLGEIADIKDAFTEFEGFVRFDGSPGIGIAVYALNHQDVLEVAQAASNYLDKKRHELPEGILMSEWADSTTYLRGRIDLMVKNLLLGAFLVFFLLILFMDLRVAFWVIFGIPVCFLGAVALMPLEMFGLTINMISLFAFILVLGIVVDDAIITGESVHRQITLHGHSLDSVVRGTRLVATPATFGVLTTIAAFSATLFTTGSFAAFPKTIGLIVIFCLIFSLIESKLILPTHLAHTRQRRRKKPTLLSHSQHFIQTKLEIFIHGPYKRFLQLCVRNRYCTCAFFIALLIIVYGMLAGGIVRFATFPEIPSEYIEASVELESGSPSKELVRVTGQIRGALHEVVAELEQQNPDEKVLKHLFEYSEDGQSARLMAELSEEENRSVTAQAVALRWRAAVGTIPSVTSLTFSASEEPGEGPPISYRLYGEDFLMLQEASAELVRYLQDFKGVYDVTNSLNNTVEELGIRLTPTAETLGLTLADVATQIRNAFYGVEAQRFQRGADEVKVMVRYPEKDRKSTATLSSMYVYTNSGDNIPLPTVAELTRKQGYQRIDRIDGKRSITVSARTNRDILEPRIVNSDIDKNFLPQFLQRYPSISAGLGDGSQDELETITSMMMGAIFALCAIYILLAIPLRSYLQPLIVMGVIPFGCIGAIIGHLIYDVILNMLSVFGIIALSGVVVNDSLILVNFINRGRAQGKDIMDATMEACTTRFRAIMLTSLTTFFGLLPILNEDSVQAQFIIPMAISLSFGIIFATVITLVLVPSMYGILNDFHLWRKGDIKVTSSSSHSPIASTNPDTATSSS